MNSSRALSTRVFPANSRRPHTPLKVKLPLLPSVRTRTSPVPLERQFVDDGFSGATLVRPAMDRLWPPPSAVSIAFMSTHPACSGGGPARAFMIG